MQFKNKSNHRIGSRKIETVLEFAVHSGKFQTCENFKIMMGKGKRKEAKGDRLSEERIMQIRRFTNVLGWAV